MTKYRSFSTTPILATWALIGKLAEGGGWKGMNNIIYEYSLEQAISDGVLAEVFKSRWEKLSGGKPIIATAHLFETVSLTGLMEIWNQFVHWKNTVMMTLPEEERLFVTEMNGN